MNVRDYYQHALSERGYQSDAAQLAAVERLQVLYDDWVAFKQVRSRPLRNLFRRPDVPRGVYMWGGVGRGKSFLMDAFYMTVPLKRKVRLHFHEFMREVHDQMRALKGVQDPLDEVASRLSKRYRLICFDEFHVSDIADAMILHKLLLKLFENGTTFVMTSNYEPESLYPEGLHRDRMLPAIRLIKERLDILNVDSGVDYRRRSLEQVRLYLSPITEQTETELQQLFVCLAEAVSAEASTWPEDGHAMCAERIERISVEAEPVAAGTTHFEPTEIIVQNRRLEALALNDDVAWFDFATLCGGPRSQNDYLELAERFKAIIVSDIPVMSARDASAARRFTWLIDVFYDHRVKVALSAEAAPGLLYTEGPLANEFHRTVSRMHEMQSRDYLESDHRAVAAL